MKLPNLKPFINEFVTLALLLASAAFKSPAFAWAAVASLLVSLVAHSVHEKLFAMKNITLVIPPEERRKVDDLVARVTAIEYGQKQRGF